MVLIHKLLTKHSLLSLLPRLLVVATACVFLAAKVRYMPFTLEDAAKAYFMLQLKLMATKNGVTPGGSMGVSGAVASSVAPVLTASSFTK